MINRKIQSIVGFDNLSSFPQFLLKKYRIYFLKRVKQLFSSLSKEGHIQTESILEQLGLILNNEEFPPEILIHPAFILWIYELEEHFNTPQASNIDRLSIDHSGLNFVLSCYLAVEKNIAFNCNSIPPIITIYPELAQIQTSTPNASGIIAIRQGEGKIVLSLQSTSKNTSLEVWENFSVQGAVNNITLPLSVRKLKVELGGASLLARYYNPNSSTFDIELWNKNLLNSFNLIGRIWPEILQEIDEFIKVIIPASSSITTEHTCGSDHKTIGTIFTSLVEEPQLSDGIIHEYRHNLLHCLNELEPIFKPDEKQPALYYSPWRPDPRPVHGVFHAVFVFYSVTEYYRRICELVTDEFDMEEMRFRLVLENTRTLIAIRELNANFELSSAGSLILEELNSHAHSLSNQLHLSSKEKRKIFDILYSEFDAWTKEWSLSPQSDVKQLLLDFLHQDIIYAPC